METGFEWAFQDSPNLVLMLDTELVCKGLSNPWRERIHLAADDELAIPLGELLDFDTQPGLEGNLENLFDQEDHFIDLPVGLIMPDGVVPATLSAWRVEDPDTQDLNLM